MQLKVRPVLWNLSSDEVSRIDELLLSVFCGPLGTSKLFLELQAGVGALLWSVDLIREINPLWLLSISPFLISKDHSAVFID